MTKVFDKRVCSLGEGPLWHPEREQLFWFDILEQRLMSRGPGGAQMWQFKEHVSAAGWIDRDHLLIASETALWNFNIEDGARTRICDLEADMPETRSNDGRADPWGGFWIGTMGKSADPKAGAIYRYYRGTLRRLVPGISISNAICFAPDRSAAYYSDTVTGQIMRQPLDLATGWPEGVAEIRVDLSGQGLNPDGAVTDADGNIWVALWGAGRISCFSAAGAHLRDVAVDATQPTCPAFGGADLCDLYVTSATVGLSPDNEAVRADAGRTFCASNIAQGLPEPQVIL